MRFMVIVKATEKSEAGVMPTSEQLLEMGRFNEELVKAGVMQAGEGLHPTSNAVRITFNGTKQVVTDGPFAETKELAAGYWIWSCKSREEAVAWLKRAPFRDGETVEIRQIFSAEDFGPALTDEVRAYEERMRQQIEQQQKR